MRTIKSLARSRIRHNRTQTILIGIAFVLTTCMLMAVSSMGVGLYRTQRENVLASNYNYHALFNQVTPTQLATLAQHLDVESVTATEIYASIAFEKMNATLSHAEILLPGIRGIPLTEGRKPESAGEIAGPPVFFERLGYENPAVGDIVEIPHRVLAEGEILTTPFTITGLQEQVDLSEYDVADTRILYSALISKELTDRDLVGTERTYHVSLRVNGEDTLSYQQIKTLIYSIAGDIGLPEDNVKINQVYLMWVCNPGTEIIAAVAGISVLIALFAALVIYGIYYVSIITNIQELGKLKALGASKGQMRSLLLREGLTIALCGLPVGLLLGYLTAKGCMEIMFSVYWPEGRGYEVSFLSLPVILIVIGVVLITALLSMLWPMKLVAKISPMEAVRYQDQDTSKRAGRKGYSSLSVGRLSIANMSRNRRRTAITIGTMGLGGILFLSFGGIISSMSELDYVRHHMPKGDFMIKINYSADDKTYPENNLNALQQTDILGVSVIEELLAIPGVTKVEPAHKALSYIHHPQYEEDRRYAVATFTREDIALMDVRQGKVDYDAMVAENGVLVSYDSSMERYGMTLGDSINLTLLDGEKQVSFQGTVVASTMIWDGNFAIPEDLMARFITEADSTAILYISVEDGVRGDYYESVKSELQQIVDSDTYLRMMSLDEELNIASRGMQAIKAALYLLIAVLGVVSFLNLINTLVTSVVTRRREIGALQAIGLSNRQLGQMLWWEGLVFTGGTLLCALTIGNLIGYMGFLWAKKTDFMGIIRYHYPLMETLIMAALLILGQFVITRLLSRYVHRESLVQRIQQ